MKKTILIAATFLISCPIVAEAMTHAEAMRLFSNALIDTYTHSSDIANLHQLQQAAQHGNLTAQYFLGRYYSRTGHSHKSFKWIHSAAEQGDARAEQRLASDYSIGIDGAPSSPKQSFYWYGKAAAQGDASAVVSMGLDYASGNGVQQNYVTAVHCLRVAAKQGSIPAEYDLGNAYAAGSGVPRNYVTADHWYRKATALIRDGKAEYSLGNAYYVGLGVPQNKITAKYWYHKASEQGYVSEANILNVFYRKYPQPMGGIFTNNRYLAAAAQIVAKAEFNLGKNYYNNGNIVPQDYITAIHWWKKAAKLGSAMAETDLGVAYFYGHGVPENYTTSYYWYHKAADNGATPAEYDLGTDYRFGRGVSPNYVTANYWYRKAAEKGYALAENDLGADYEEGLGVPQSSTQAFFWYQKAAAQGDVDAEQNLHALESGN